MKGNMNNSLVVIEEIRQKDIDVEKLADRAVKDEGFRNILVSQLLTNKDIMVYYHCYYILSKASEDSPEVFYPFWNSFAGLLDHNNSYHRDIGSTIIANLVCVDKNHYLDGILDIYLKHVNDEKFMTGQCFVRNLARVVSCREDLGPGIITFLLGIDKNSSYPEKQRELLKCSILEVLEAVYDESGLKEGISRFIRDSLKSKSPKTKKKAEELCRKYNLPLKA